MTLVSFRSASMQTVRVGTGEDMKASHLNSAAARPVKVCTDVFARLRLNTLYAGTEQLASSLCWSCAYDGSQTNIRSISSFNLDITIQ